LSLRNVWSLYGRKVDKLRKDIPFVDAVGIDPGEARAGKIFGAREILKEENRRP
jgi:hypothetical protein